MGARIAGPAGQAGAAAQQNSDINVTPFVDIMLVLLIIFMVAAPLATVSMKLDLPPSDGETIPTAEPVYVTVQRNGDLFIAERKSSLQTLAPDVCAALGGGDCKAERVFVRGEAETRYGQFMAVMSDLHSHGFTKVGLINEDIE